MIRIEKIAFEKGFFVTKEGVMYNLKNQNNHEQEKLPRV